jgi:hypothetical protein
MEGRQRPGQAAFEVRAAWGYRKDLAIWPGRPSLMSSRAIPRGATK